MVSQGSAKCWDSDEWKAQKKGWALLFNTCWEKVQLQDTTNRSLNAQKRTELELKTIISCKKKIVIQQGGVQFR